MNSSSLAQTRLFKGLTAGEVEALLGNAVPVSKRFRRGERIWHDGETVDGIGLLMEGTLLCQLHQPDGKKQLIRFLNPSDIINAEAGVSLKKTSPASFEAKSLGEYLWFSNSTFLDNEMIPAEHISVIKSNLLAYLADDAIRLMKRVDLLSCYKVRERLILYLDTLRETQGDTFRIDVSQEKLAQYLCVDRSSLSTELNKMRRDGLIEFDRRKFTLKYPLGRSL